MRLLGGIGQQYGVHLRGQLVRPDGAAGGHAYPEGLPQGPRHVGQGAPGPAGVSAEIEQAERAGALGRHDDPRVGLLEGADRDHEVTDGGTDRLGGHRRS